MVDEKDEEWKIYLLPASILIASLMVSAAVFYSATVLSTNMFNLQSSLQTAISTIQLNLNGNNGGNYGGGNVVVPTPTPTVANTGDQFKLTGEEFRGAEDGKIVIVEYSDFECPFCSRVNPTVEQILTDYPNEVKFYFQHFPLSSIHPDAQNAAEAFECAAEQGKAYEMHDLMFANQGALTLNDLSNYAVQAGANKAQFDSCMSSHKYASEVSAESSRAQSLGVGGTPTLFINGVKIVGAQPYSVFQAEIEKQLQAAG